MPNTWHKVQALSVASRGPTDHVVNLDVVILFAHATAVHGCLQCPIFDPMIETYNLQDAEYVAERVVINRLYHRLGHHAKQCVDCLGNLILRAGDGDNVTSKFSAWDFQSSVELQDYFKCSDFVADVRTKLKEQYEVDINESIASFKPPALLRVYPRTTRSSGPGLGDEEPSSWASLPELRGTPRLLQVL
jgi:hypothetical protein